MLKSLSFLQDYGFRMVSYRSCQSQAPLTSLLPCLCSSLVIFSLSGSLLLADILCYLTPLAFEAGKDTAPTSMDPLSTSGFYGSQVFQGYVIWHAWYHGDRSPRQDLGISLCPSTSSHTRVHWTSLSLIPIEPRISLARGSWHPQNLMFPAQIPHPLAASLPQYPCSDFLEQMLQTPGSVSWWWNHSDWPILRAWCPCWTLSRGCCY